MSWIAVAVAALSLLTSTALAFAAYRAGNRISGAEADRAGRDAWNKFNELALADDESLRLADELLSYESRAGDTPEQIRRRWLGYVLLNALAIMYMNAIHGRTLSRDIQLGIVDTHLSGLLRHEDIFEMTQLGYEEPFMSECRRVRERVLSA